MADSEVDTEAVSEVDTEADTEAALEVDTEAVLEAATEVAVAMEDMEAPLEALTPVQFLTVVLLEVDTVFP